MQTQELTAFWEWGMGNGELHYNIGGAWLKIGKSYEIKGWAVFEV